jgi:hypothetical protein
MRNKGDLNLQLSMLTLFSDEDSVVDIMDNIQEVISE